MKVTSNIKKTICSLFEVHGDEGGIQRVVTPMEYAGTGDKIVVRVRPTKDGYQIDENGEAAFQAALAGADVDGEAIERWRADLAYYSPVMLDDEETLKASTNRPELVTPYIFRVADAAQQLHAIATSRADRQADNFKALVSETIHEIAATQNWAVQDQVELPIAGALFADHVIEPNSHNPIVIIVAPSAVRLLEAELIWQAYQQDGINSTVIALSKSQEAVGKKQYERSAYYLDRSLIFMESAMQKLLPSLVQ